MVELEPIDRLKAALSRAPNPATFTIEQQRAATAELAVTNPPAADIRATEAIVGGVKGAWIDLPTSRPDHVLLYIHGGAFVAGSAHSHRSIAGELARHAKARVFSVDYRLAPEAPFPAALDDCLQAYRALAAHTTAKKLAVAGDSAGGGLALSLLMNARDHGVRQADAAYLISPWADLTCGAMSFKTLGDIDPIVSLELLKQSARRYLDGVDPMNKRASPVFGDFRGLPPILIQVGGCEVLLDDSETIAKNAVACEGEVTLDVWPDMIHVWQAFTGFLPQANDALQRAGDYLDTVWKEQQRP